MKAIHDLVDEQSLRKLATPSNFRLGKEVFERGGVQIIAQTPFQVTAKARSPGGQNRTVVLTATPEGLKCGCT